MALMFGEKVLSDFEPAIGTILQVNHVSKNVQVELFDSGRVVVRSSSCIFLVANKGRALKKANIFRDSLMAKAFSIPLHGHADNSRSGLIIVREWHPQYKRHGQTCTGPRVNYELYAIIIDGHLVFRNINDPEMNMLFPETIGEPDVDALCNLRDQTA